MTRHAISYARQSVGNADDGDDSLSIAHQHARNRAAAQSRGDTIVAEFSDVDVSGARAAREGLDAALAHVARGDIAATYIYNVARLARDTWLLLDLVRTLDKRNVALVSATEPIEDRTLLTVIGAFAERERVRISNDTAGAVRAKAKRGEHTQTPPYGYRRIRDDRGLLLIPDERESPVIAEVYRRYAAGAGLAELRDWLLTDPSVPSPRGGGRWTTTGIFHALRRPTYAGYVYLNATTDPHGRERPAVREEGRHVAIVDRATWEAVQARIGQRPPHLKRKAWARPWYDGLLDCAACGRRLYLQRSNRGTPLLRCSTDVMHRTRRVAAPCPGGQGSRKAATIEAVARESLAAALDGLVTVEAAITEAERLRTPGDAGRSVQLGRALADLARRRSTLLDAFEAGGLDYERWHLRDTDLAARIAAAEAERDTLPAEIDRVALTQLRERYVGLGALIRVMGDDALRELAVATLGRCAVDLAAIAAWWRFPPPLDLLVGRYTLPD